MTDCRSVDSVQPQAPPRLEFHHQHVYFSRKRYESSGNTKQWTGQVRQQSTYDCPRKQTQNIKILGGQAFFKNCRAYCRLR